MSIIAFTAHMGAGKDTAAEVLVQDFSYKKVRMADPLKEMLRAFYRYAGLDEKTIERKIEGDLKQEPCDLLLGKTPRFAMQTLGHEWRDFFGKELWSNLWQIKVRGQDNIVCTDVRYKHEVEAVKAVGGIVAKIERLGHKVDMSHGSEQEIPQIDADVIILNNGTVRDLHDQVQRLA